jgi:tRNA(Ile)-lysidine synthase
MASSKLPPANKTNLLTRVHTFFTRVFHISPQPVYHLLVAYSGGVDSTVLLHALHSLKTQLHADTQALFQIRLSAMHVHHGLNQHADAWVRHCQQTCAALTIPLQVNYVQLDTQSGLGVEATARNARYAALQDYAADFICLAHHQDDQAETLLLQLMRGAGVKGLASMAEVDTSSRLIRPLLALSRQEIEGYAKAHGLKWVEDDSNQNTALDRNFMRHQVLPLLASHYPGVSKTLSRTAQHMAEASDLLADLATIDAQQMLVSGMPANQRCLDITQLAGLSLARAKNVLRWWINLHGVQMPTADTLAQVLQQLLHARADAAIHLQIAPGYVIKRYLGLAYLVKDEVAITPINKRWLGESRMQITPNDSLVFETRMGEGLSQQKLINASLRIRTREGGERFRPALGRPSRTLKHILQAHNVPPWQRLRVPLVFMDETLVCIPNVGVDANMAAQANEMGVVIRWEYTD